MYYSKPGTTPEQEEHSLAISNLRRVVILRGPEIICSCGHRGSRKGRHCWGVFKQVATRWAAMTNVPLPPSRFVHQHSRHDGNILWLSLRTPSDSVPSLSLYVRYLHDQAPLYQALGLNIDHIQLEDTDKMHCEPSSLWTAKMDNMVRTDAPNLTKITFKRCQAHGGVPGLETWLKTQISN
jgi:hypothetical protein